MLFQLLLRRTIRHGTLRLITAEGRDYTFGDGRDPSATIRLHRTELRNTLALNPALKIGEAYADGTLTLEEGTTLQDFLHIAILNQRRLGKNPWLRLLNWLQRPRWDNTIPRAWRDVSAHYNLSPRLYELFLDSDLQYSCAYFTHPRATLEQAQQDKKRHLAAKLHLHRPDLKILDIGSGWGGLALYLAREAQADVTGLTLSSEQRALSQQRAVAAGLEDRCRFALRDYREECGTYDRIVSVGMFEHVGHRNYSDFFAQLYSRLEEDGVALLHAIGCFDAPYAVNPFIRKYIFPGAEIPGLSEVMKAVEGSGLFVTDIEILRLHYAQTLRLWNQRFQARRDEAAKLYDERFCRLWEFYLIGCEMAFRHGHLMVFQMQLTKRLGTLPILRDYMHEAEKQLHQRAPWGVLEPSALRIEEVE